MQILKTTGAALAALMLTTASALAAAPALFTAAQATAGATAYTQNCAMCHGADLKGVAGPALIGPAFASAATEATVGGIFTEISQQMPAGQPGSLTKTQYEDIMAYILQQNGYPAGTTALNYAASMTSTTPIVSLVH